MVHVLDAVLLPTRTIQQVQPFSVAIDKGSVEASPSTTSGSSGGSGGSGSSSTGLAGGNSSGGGGSNSSSDQTSPAAAAASLEAAWRSPAQDTPAAAGPGGCYRSIAAAIDASPQLTIDKTIAFLAGWDLSHPGLNVTLFLPSGLCMWSGRCRVMLALSVRSLLLLPPPTGRRVGKRCTAAAMYSCLRLPASRYNLCPPTQPS